MKHVIPKKELRKLLNTLCRKIEKELPDEDMNHVKFLCVVQWKLGEHISALIGKIVS